MGRLKSWLIGWLGIDLLIAAADDPEIDGLRSENAELIQRVQGLEDILGKAQARLSAIEDISGGIHFLPEKLEILGSRLLILERRAQDAPPPRAQAINRLRSLSEAQGGFRDVGISAVHGA